MDYNQLINGIYWGYSLITNQVVATQTSFKVQPEILGEMIQFDEHIFSDGLVQPPTTYVGPK